MKKWLYLIPPIVGIGVFIAFYAADQRRRDERDAEHKAKQLVQQAEDAKKKADADKNAKAALEQKSAERAADAKKKEDAKALKVAQERQKIADETKDALDMSATRGREITANQARLAADKAEREKMNRDWVAAVQEVENLKVQRRVAELERERVEAMIDAKLKNSPILSLPPLMYSPEQQKQIMAQVFGVGAGGGGGGSAAPDADAQAAIQKINDAAANRINGK